MTGYDEAEQQELHEDYDDTPQGTLRGGAMGAPDDSGAAPLGARPEEEADLGEADPEDREAAEDEVIDDQILGR